MIALPERRLARHQRAPHGAASDLLCVWSTCHHQARWHAGAQVIGGYPGAEVVWCQEEPKNMGAWSYVWPRLETALRPHPGGDATQVTIPDTLFI